MERSPDSLGTRLHSCIANEENVGLILILTATTAPAPHDGQRGFGAHPFLPSRDPGAFEVVAKTIGGVR